MKTNMRRLGSMVMAVGMMSALSLTAFGAEAIPATKLVAATATVEAKEAKAGNSILITKIISISDNNAKGNRNVEGGKISFVDSLQAIPGFTVNTLADGSLELVNKETGTKVKVVKAAKTTPSIPSTVRK